MGLKKLLKGSQNKIEGRRKNPPIIKSFWQLPLILCVEEVHAIGLELVDISGSKNVCGENGSFLCCCQNRNSYGKCLCDFWGAKRGFVKKQKKLGFGYFSVSATRKLVSCSKTQILWRKFSAKSKTIIFINLCHGNQKHFPNGSIQNKGIIQAGALPTTSAVLNLWVVTPF